MLNIKGYGDNLTVNNIRIGDLSPKEHEKMNIELTARFGVFYVTDVALVMRETRQRIELAS